MENRYKTGTSSYINAAIINIAAAARQLALENLISKEVLGEAKKLVSLITNDASEYSKEKAVENFIRLLEETDMPDRAQRHLTQVISNSLECKN